MRKDTVKKNKRYAAARNRLALIEPLYLLVFLAIMQLTGLSEYMTHFSYSLSRNFYGAIAVYILVFSAIYYSAFFCLKLYGGFLLEHRFGLSNQTFGGWLKDEAKGGILSFMLFLLFAELLFFLITYAPGLWWLLMALGWIVIDIILAKVFPVLILPLFFKYEKLNNAELKNRLMRLGRKCGVKVLDVFRLNLSAKTKKANAALVGMGKTRRILLGDTLIEGYSKDEIEVVMAHELAHHKLLHMWKLLFTGAAGSIIIFFLVKLVLSKLVVEALQLETPGDLAIFPSILFFMVFFSTLLTPAQNSFSRRLEKAADHFALEATKAPAAFISCMKSLAKQNLADPEPNRFIEIALYNHPPISKRIKMAKKFK